MHSDIANHPPLDAAVSATVQSGWSAFQQHIGSLVGELCAGERTVLVGIDGYTGTDWSRVKAVVEQVRGPGIQDVQLIAMKDCELPQKELDAFLVDYLPEGEPLFGRVYRGGMRDFFDGAEVEKLSMRLRAAKRQSRPGLLVCYGRGASLPELARHYDLTFYFDCTREEALKRNRTWAARKGQTQSVSPRRIYYINFPVGDRHRRNALQRADYYVDGNDIETPKIMPIHTLSELVASLMKMPLRIKPMYEPGVWGGQWLKRNRGLPDSMINCAYGYEVIAPEQSLLAVAGKHTVELPFNLLMELQGAALVGKHTLRRFGLEFPIRISFDDTWEGGNLSIQAHPTTAYVRKTFNERMHQAEMYYVFDAMPGAISHLGLRNGTRKEDFLEMAARSEREGKPFDHTKYVNVVPARKGDILLIPPGTVHGAGANALILEISSTPYRYTFKIYDYCRPNLDGTFRPLHIKHAFSNIKFFRNESWVRENLLPKPVLVEEGSSDGQSWREYVIADRGEFHHVVHRLEFDRYCRSLMKGRFHMVNLVEGDMVRIAPLPRTEQEGENSRLVAYSETLLIPASVGAYEIINQTDTPCKVVVSFIRS